MAFQKAETVYRVLDRPSVYALAQVVFAPGQRGKLTRIFETTAARLPPARRILDVGCGPSSWLWRLGLHPVGVDIAPSYIRRFATVGRGVVASSMGLPFPKATFDQTWCFGLLHHLSDDDARGTLSEMRRATAAGGTLIVMDAVLPRSLFKRPLAHLIRKLDRGAYVRNEDRHRELLGAGWNVTRELMSYTGLEVTVAMTQV